MGGTSLAGFDARLRKDKRDRDDALFMMDTGELGNMHDVVDVKSGKIGMNCRPETLQVVSGQQATIDSTNPVVPA